MLGRGAVRKVLGQFAEIVAVLRTRLSSPSAFFFRAGMSAAGLFSVQTKISRSTTVSGRTNSLLWVVVIFHTSSWLMMILEPTSLRITSWVRSWLRMLFLKSSKSWPALGDFALQIFHGGDFILLANLVQRLTTSVSTLMPMSLPRCTSSELSIRSRSRSFSFAATCSRICSGVQVAAVLLRLAGESVARFLQVFSRNDFVVDAGDDFLDHVALVLRSRGNAKAGENQRENQPVAWFHHRNLLVFQFIASIPAEAIRF